MAAIEGSLAVLTVPCRSEHGTPGVGWGGAPRGSTSDSEEAGGARGDVGSAFIGVCMGRDR